MKIPAVIAVRKNPIFEKPPNESKSKRRRRRDPASADRRPIVNAALAISSRFPIREALCVGPPERLSRKKKARTTARSASGQPNVRSGGGSEEGGRAAICRMSEA